MEVLMSVFSDFLQRLALEAVPLLVPFIIALLIAQTRRAWAAVIKEQPDVAYYLSRAAQIAVVAAEQAGIAGIIDDKKKYALEVAERWLVENKITIDLHLIDAAIEAAVYEQLTANKLRELQYPALLSDPTQGTGRSSSPWVDVNSGIA